MKSLIVFYGLPRALEYTHQSIISNLNIDNAEKIGVFIHKSVYSNERSSEKNEKINFDKVKEKLKLDEIVLVDKYSNDLINYKEKFKKYQNRFDDNGGSQNNLIEQLYTLLIASNFIHEKYQKVYFIRPDLLYLDKEIKRSMGSYDMAIPNWQSFGGYNDRFSICYSTNAAKCYAKRLEIAEEYCKTYNTGIHAEELLYYSIKKNKQKINLIGMRAVRVRNNGYHLIEDFNKITLRSRIKRKLKTIKSYI